MTTEIDVLRSERDAALERCAQICRDQIKVFASTEYAMNQPMSSFGERFACEACAKAIEALITGGENA